MSLKRFLRYEPFDETPDHSSLSRIRCRLPWEVFEAVHRFVLEVLYEYNLLDGTTVGVDSTVLEANAAMSSLSASERRTKSIVRNNSGEDWGAYKAEHVVDLKTEAIIEAKVYHANEADTATLVPSLESAQEHLDQSTGLLCDLKKVVADTGDHAAQTLKDARDALGIRSKTYIPEPQRKSEWDWSKRTDAERRAVTNNRHRTQRDNGKRLQKRRSEVVERSFAHTCETGGGRRSWLRGIDEVRKRHLMTATAHNLGLVLRKLLGSGKVRQFTAMYSRGFAFAEARWSVISSLWSHDAQWNHLRHPSRANSLAPLILV